MQIKRIRICIQHIYIIANCDDTGGIVRRPLRNMNAVMRDAVIKGLTVKIKT